MKMLISDCKIIFLSFWIESVWLMSAYSLLNKKPVLSLKGDMGSDIADLIAAKGYVPKEKDLPKPSIVKNIDNDVTYLLSKLPDEDLVKILSDQPAKNEYNVKDLIEMSTHIKKYQKYNRTLGLGQKPRNKPLPNDVLLKDISNKRFQTVSNKGGSSQPQEAYFKLDHKPVDPFASHKNVDKEYAAVQKINNLLYSHPIKSETNDDDDDEKKELMFDILVAQLKTLCCKRNKPAKNHSQSEQKIKSLFSDAVSKETKTYMPDIRASQITTPQEQMFLILNDEIKNNGNEEDDLISVDPDSLGSNTTVMLLGPIATPLSDVQLKVVMMRISNELAKPEYVPLLQQISAGKLTKQYMGITDSILSGPQTRRYIKPHRCNHQSPLARVYGGPKWIICTGYLNLNKPSLYD